MAAPCAAVQHGGAGFQGSSKRPPTGRDETGHPVRYYALDPGFHGFPKGRPAGSVMLVVSV